MNINKLFSKFDKSADAYLDITEFGLLIRRIDNTLEDEEIEIIFLKFDDDKDGFITYEEFEKTINNLNNNK